MQYLDFEKPIEELSEQLEKLQKIGENGRPDMNSAIKEIEEKIAESRKNLYSHLTGWQQTWNGTARLGPSTVRFRVPVTWREFS